MIAARLDALPPVEKALLQDASVIGKVFWPGAIGDPDEQSLHALERKEFVRRDRRSAVAGETQYAFLHALVRDVAYGQIPRAQRAERHRRAARWIESLAQDRTDDRVEMLAYHYREALALAGAAGVDASELREPARLAFTEAALRAAALNSWSPAAALADEALALTPEDSRERPDLLLLLAQSAQVLVRAGGEAHAVAARDAFLALDDRAGAAEAEALHSRLLWRQGDGAGSATAGRNALALTEGLPVSVRVARTVSVEAGRCMLAGETARAIELADRARDMAESLGQPDLSARALVVRGTARVNDGDSGGLEDMRRALEIVSTTNAAEASFTAHNNYGFSLWILGRLDEAEEARERCERMCARFGFRQGIAWSTVIKARDLVTRGELDGALAGITRYFELTGGVPNYVDVGARSMRSEIELARGATDTAIADAQEALEGARRSGDPQQLAVSVVAAAWVALATGRLDEGDSLLSEALANHLTVDVSWPLPLLLAERDRAEELVAAARKEYRWREAARLVAAGDLVGAADAYAAIGARYPEAWTRLLAAEAGDESQLGRARETFLQMGATRFLTRCDALLQASA